MEQFIKLKIPGRLVLGIGALTALSFSAVAEDDADYTEMAPPELFGVMVAQQVGLERLGFSDEEKLMFLAGIEAGLDDVSMEEIQEQLPRLQQFLQGRAEAFQAAQALENKEAAAAFIADLESDPDVILDDAGFYYEIIEAGNESMPGATDEVVVNYKGELIDGTVFDSSYDRGQPATFAMDRVVPGFSGGLSKIGEGGKVRIYIPAELAYGDNPPPQSPIPPGAMLVFDAEIEEVIASDGSE